MKFGKMANSTQFMKAIDSFVKDANVGYRKKLTKAVKVGYDSTVQSSRVDLGYLRLGWKVSMFKVPRFSHVPDEEKSETAYPYSAGDKPSGLEKTLAGLDSVVGKLKFGTIGNLFISNQVPYASEYNEEDGMTRDAEKAIKEVLNDK